MILNKITDVIIMLSTITESAMLCTYIIGLYFLFTSNIRNGLQKSLIFMLFSGILYSMSLLALLVMIISNILDISSIYMFSTIATMFFLTRVSSLFSKLFLAHELRLAAIRQRNNK